jgi:hypothetical protein
MAGRYPAFCNAARILAHLANVYWQEGRQQEAEDLLAEARDWAPVLFKPATRGS